MSRKHHYQYMCLFFAGVLMCFVMGLGYFVRWGSGLLPGSILLVLPVCLVVILPGILLLPWLKQVQARPFFTDDIRRWAAFLTVSVFLPRLIVWAFWAPAPVSDYARYVQYGMQVAQTGELQVDDFVLKAAPNIWLYVTILGRVMSVFGSTALTAQCFCMVLNFANILLFHYICRDLLGVKRAYLLSCFFALLPENVFYSILPGIEAISMFPMLLGLLLVIRCTGRTASKQALMFVGGALLAFSAANRPNALAAVIAVFAWMLLNRKGSRFVFTKTEWLGLGLFCLGVAAVTGWHHLEQNILFAGEKPAGSFGWSVYEGLDYAGGGGWTPAKLARRTQVISTHSAQDAQQILLQQGLARFATYSTAQKIELFLRKGAEVWMLSSYILLNNMFVEVTMTILTCAVWICFMSTLLALMIDIGVNDRTICHRNCVWMCLAALIPTVIWHEVGTSIARYHYMLLPFLILMAGGLFPRRSMSRKYVFYEG